MKDDGELLERATLGVRLAIVQADHDWVWSVWHCDCGCAQFVKGVVSVCW